MKKSTLVALLVALTAAFSMHVILDAQGQVGPNIDVITGVGDPLTGDPFRQRHNEAVVAISGVNPDHMMVAYNDYSTVDYANDSGLGTPSPAQSMVAKVLNFFRAPWRRERKSEAEEEIAAAQAWMGWSFSDNGGKSWSKGLHYGHPFDHSGLAPELFGYQAVSDPVIASTHDKFFLGGIAFTPGGLSAGFVSVLTDQNNTERNRNTVYDYTRVLVTSDATHFVDKPSIAALGDHVYAAFVLFDEADPTKLSSKILFFRSTDRGNTWSNPGIVISQPLTRNQSPWILVDPNNENTVYIGWRVFSAVTGGLANAIVGKKSTNGGVSFTASYPWPVALLLKAFDQPQGVLNLSANPRTLPIPRSNAYPTAAIDGNGAIHVALQEWVSPSTGLPLGPFASTSTGVPRITVTSSYNGGALWTLRKAIDFGADSGTQFMPAMTAVGEPGTSCNGAGPRSRVMVMYYDARASTKIGYVAGGNKQFDVRLAEASACTKDSLGRLVFGPSQQMSRYTLDPTAPGQIVRNAGYGYASVNRAYEMFGGGAKAFTGDYIHLIPRVPYVNTATGWKPTVANGVDRDKLPAPVVQGVWADTRVAVLPTTPATGLLPNDALFIDSLAWWNYQPPGTGKAPNACDNAGSRSQDVFTADYTPNNLFAAAPVTFRTSNVPRSYPLYIENRAGVQRFFRLTIDATAMASFNYRTFVSPPAAFDRTADVAVGPYSTVTGSIVVGPGVSTPVSISIAQIASLGAPNPMSNGAKTTVTLNTAGAALFTQTESHAPIVQPQPTVSHPFQGTTVLPRAAGPANPLPSPYTDNPYTDNPYTDNPYTDNVTVYDVVDVKVSVTNGGDSAGAFSALLNVQNRLALQGFYVFQTFIHRISKNPGLNGCQTVEQRQDIQISTIKAPYTDNPYTDNPYTDNPYTDNPYTDNAQPDARASNSTFYLAPAVAPGQNPGAANRPDDEVVYVLRASQIAQNPPPANTFNPTAQVSLTVVANTPNVVPLAGGGFGFDPGGSTVSSGGAAVPVKLAFVQPASSAPGQAFSVQVAIVDAFGNPITNSTQPVTLALANNPGGGTLAGFTGPKNAVGGIATFTGLSINNVGNGYTLVATSATLTAATSAPFDVFPPVTITTLALPEGTKGQSYSQTVFASGGTGAYTWDIKPIPGSPQFMLPDGLTLTAQEGGAAKIAGTPLNFEVRSFRLRVTDGAGHSATQDLCIHINESTGGDLAVLPKNADTMAATIAQTLVGEGVTISSVTYTGVDGALGTFSGGFSTAGLSSGIILSSGLATNVLGPNNSDSTSSTNGSPGDADLDALVTPLVTHDAAVLEFDFVVTNANATVVKFDYVLASEEYNEFANSSFNDVFAFFLSGPNLPKANFALIPGTTMPVSINTVNGGGPTFGVNPQHPELFINNDVTDLGGATPILIQADGLTKVLSLQANIVPNQTYHLKIAIADTNDSAFDSWVMLKAGSLSAVCSIIPSCPTCGQH